MKNHHISEAGVSFEIQFGLWIKIWSEEHIVYIWQQTIALRHNIYGGIWKAKVIGRWLHLPMPPDYKIMP